MDLLQAHALARIDECAPHYTTAVLRDTGHGDLADQWLDAASAFRLLAQQACTPQGPEQQASAQVVRAYARLCRSWSSIRQLRENALASTDAVIRPR